MSCSTSREENATQLSFERLYRCVWYRICPVHLFLLCIELHVHTIHCARGRSRHQMLEERRNKPWHYMAGPESIDQLGFKMRSPTSKIYNMWGSDSAAWDQITFYDIGYKTFRGERNWTLLSRPYPHNNIYIYISNNRLFFVTQYKLICYSSIYFNIR